jgi:SAM-dependent methyltransferase
MAYEKKNGYAGDYEMMNHIYENKPNNFIDRWCLNRKGAQAVRYRAKLITKILLDNSKFYTNISVLGCGPSKEVKDFFDAGGVCRSVTLYDLDINALNFAKSVLHKSLNVKYVVKNLVKWSLYEKHKPTEDIMYSIGLCDYFEDKMLIRFINACYDKLLPGGLFIFGNFSYYEDSSFLSNALDWKLIYRSEDDLRRLMKKTKFNKYFITSEETDINLFVICNKEY